MAVMAVNIEQYVPAELDITICETVFWTGSTVVLQYIKSEGRRFHVFVANRISVIRELFTPLQWRHVGTMLNPTDLASRGLSAHELFGNKLRLEGPD